MTADFRRLLTLRSALLAVCTSNLVVSCQALKRQQSAVKIAGGTPVEDGRYPEVIQFHSENGVLFEEQCTGVFIDPQVILTAGHCVWKQSDPKLALRQTSYDPGDFEELPRKHIPNPYADDIAELEKNPGSQKVSFALAGEQGLPHNSHCFLVTPGWALGSGGPGSRHDLAMILLDPKDQSKSVASRLTQPAAAGMKVTYVGFGWNEKFGVDHGIKREGHNQIGEVTKDGVIQTYGGSTGKPMVREGDSGGPLYIDNKLAGIASALQYGIKKSVCDGTTCEDKVVDVGFHVDLTEQRNIAFIERGLQALKSGQIDPNVGKGCASRNKSEFIRALQNKSYLGGS